MCINNTNIKHGCNLEFTYASSTLAPKKQTEKDVILPKGVGLEETHNTNCIFGGLRGGFRRCGANNVRACCARVIETYWNHSDVLLVYTFLTSQKKSIERMVIHPTRMTMDDIAQCRMHLGISFAARCQSCSSICQYLSDSPLELVYWVYITTHITTWIGPRTYMKLYKSVRPVIKEHHNLTVDLVKSPTSAARPDGTLSHSWWIMDGDSPKYDLKSRSNDPCPSRCKTEVHDHWLPKVFIHITSMLKL